MIQAFLLSYYLDDVKRLRFESRLENALILNTQKLKRKIVERFLYAISFHNKGKFFVVHCSGIRPCEYTIAVLKGIGLKDNDIMRPFGALIQKKKIKEHIKDEKKFEWLYSPEELMGVFERSRLPEICNAI